MLAGDTKDNWSVEKAQPGNLFHLTSNVLFWNNCRKKEPAITASHE